MKGALEGLSNAPVPIRAAELIVAGGIAILAVGLGLRLGSVPPAASDPIWWWWLHWIVLLAALPVLLWGLWAIIAWASGQAGRSKRTIRSRTNLLPRVRLTVQRGTSTAGRGGVGDAHGWLPNPSDLSTINLSSADLDEALFRVNDLSRATLGPDTQVQFMDLSLVPEQVLRLRAWSRKAWRTLDFRVSSRGITNGPLRPGSGRWVSGPHGEDVPAWLVALPPPWRHDPRWSELVKQVGYRTRPLRANSVVVEYVDRWRVTVQSRDEGASKALREVDYELEGNELVVFDRTQKTR
jgi:hypothetical protein